MFPFFITVLNIHFQHHSRFGSVTIPRCNQISGEYIYIYIYLSQLCTLAISRHLQQLHITTNCYVIVYPDRLQCEHLNSVSSTQIQISTYFLKCRNEDSSAHFVGWLVFCFFSPCTLLFMIPGIWIKGSMNNFTVKKHNRKKKKKKSRIKSGLFIVKCYFINSMCSACVGMSEKVRLVL